MNASIRQKLEKVCYRHEEVGRLLADPDVIGGGAQFRDLSVEFARLQPVADGYRDYCRIETELAAAQELLREGDSSMRGLAGEEIPQLEAALEERRLELQKLLLPRDPRDERSIYLEVRAGTGGDEAAIFAGDLLRMYSRYAERRGWLVETLSENPGEHGGYREVICRVAGRGVFSRLKFESGTHRTLTRCIAPPLHVRRILE